MAESHSPVRPLGPEDNPAILALERRGLAPERPGRGLADRMVLETDRSPDFFTLRRQMGGALDALGVFDQDQLIGVACVVGQAVTWEGASIDRHYVCDMLIDPARRGGRSLFRLRAAIHGRCVRGRPGVTHVLEANHAMHRALDGRARLPTYRPVDVLRYVSWPVLRPVARPRGYTVQDAAAATWREGYERYRYDWNLVPVEPGEPLAGERRLVARRGGRVVAVASLIEETGRRVVVRGLTLKNQLYRHAHNLAARLTGSPRLPGIGSVRPRLIVGNLLYDRADPDAALALFAAARDYARQRGLPLVFAALSESDPLLPRLNRHASPARLLALATQLPDAPAGPTRPSLGNVHQI